MNSEELLQWADDIVFAKAEKHLDSLQMAILEGAWQGLKYEELAKKCHRSKSHVKNIAAELWQTLSDMLGEDINKVNVRSILERKALSTIYNYGHSSQIVSSNINSRINICAENRQYPEDTKERSPFPPNSPQNKSQSPIINLTDAPELTSFYDRTSELSTLKQWISQAHTRLITVYGLSGIGKSAIALKLIEQTQTQFDYTIWLSLADTPTLSTLQTELKQFFGRSPQPPLPTVIDYFRSSRCLVILDDVQNIFKSSQLAGQYLAGYEDYGKFLKQIATSSHQSCLILLSWEKPREITTLEAVNRPARTLHLKGLGEQAAEIIREKELTDEEKWSDLIALYQGHPSWLNIIASTILELFDGSVSRFLADKNDIYLGDLEPFLESQLERLSESEKKVGYWLATQDEAVDISQQPADSELSKSELWQAIQSLARRGLVEKVLVGVRSKFQINPVFKAYIQSHANLI
ncbi:MAG: ATP-binding protein [Microcoleus sp. PH2017_10_PVI_O_A]|uniref:NB-ARC domain-containing protein n=1 Tax=unclassified Microcoleus TaxID=2642155 RepID=UPI001DB2F52E|nr:MULTISPECIES: ATP-binding protein [unclassified Microcoleus]TAE79687.1 MAG: ATP-binding protein [Oscillatoriales cyanobacterium]MCC3407998.1 ATP-binding protein [Microcoleus sp. PH2017_10_PVI_O_A]MCC3460129.1 ATP-binding protein [Microcoleus sp. PH2017_11_PCY_U_A]MCC3480140.1 ATP-binding protein [Microcoleus sp. PH2017_12_PCY_D_A]MCC3561455.1 ATP-binding protein [Microcoleus sp. PH2017_27_LUM_O_A]